MKVSTIWIGYFGVSAAVAIFGFGIAIFSGISFFDSLRTGLFFGGMSLGITSPVLCMIENWTGINLNIPLWRRRRGAMATLNRK